MIYKVEIDEKKANYGFVNSALALGLASRDTLNIIAAKTRKKSIINVKNNFIIRNNFTEKNIQFEKTSYIKTKRQETKTGATLKAQYLEVQEIGGIKKTKSGKNVGIPQTEARGGNKARVVLKNYYKRKLKQRIRWNSKKQLKRSKASRLVAVAYMAKKIGKSFNYSDNTYFVSSFNKFKNNVKFRKKHIYNYSNKSVKINAEPWLFPAATQVIASGQSIFNSQIKRLLKQKLI